MGRERRYRRIKDEVLPATAPPVGTGTRPALRPAEHTVLGLQSSVGNAAVARLVGGGGRSEEATVAEDRGDVEEEPDWEAPIEDEADVRTEAGGARHEDGGGTATATVEAAPAAPARFPGYRSMKGNETVAAEAWKAWKETLRTTTTASRREQGFWIQWDGTTTANATGTFRAVGHAVGPVAGPTVGATISLGTKPADSGGWFTVGSFHTHTPTRHRGVGRPVGPSGADISADTSDNVAGLVYDYEAARGTTIPAKWPLWSDARVYHSGPNVRT
jgi:hypothetical protein